MFKIKLRLIQPNKQQDFKWPRKSYLEPKHNQMRNKQNLTRSKQCMMPLWLRNRCKIIEDFLVVHLFVFITLCKVHVIAERVVFMVQALLEDAESCRRRMQAASALIGGLGGEKIRWTEQSKQFKSQIDRQCTSYNAQS